MQKTGKNERIGAVGSLRSSALAVCGTCGLGSLMAWEARWGNVASGERGCGHGDDVLTLLLCGEGSKEAQPAVAGDDLTSLGQFC